jgi:hypothetical protein
MSRFSIKMVPFLMNDEGKKPCTEDTAGMEWLKAPHKAFGSQRSQRDQGPIFWQPNSTLLGC